MFVSTVGTVVPFLWTALVAALGTLSSWVKGLRMLRVIIPKFHRPSVMATRTRNRDIVEVLAAMAEYHETAARLDELVRKDGAGSWPPRANHNHSTWPAALKPYKEIYHEMAPLLPASDASLDDEVNRQRVTSFRDRFQLLLRQRVDLRQVARLLEAADAGRWDVFPRDVYNAFYSCVAWCRHAYRWGTIPAVKVAQLEKTLCLPTELTIPWAAMQSHFGLTSDAGNMMANLVLNFHPRARSNSDSNSNDSDITSPSYPYTYIHRINTGLPRSLSAALSSEAEFARIPHEMERCALPLYVDVAGAIAAHARGDVPACLARVRAVSAGLRAALASFHARAHDGRIGRAVWLSRVQGFYAWGLLGVDKKMRKAVEGVGVGGREGLGEGGGEGEGEEDAEWETIDGLSGNQVLLFQVLDAFLGLDPYLTPEMLERNVPRLQREFCAAVRRHGFRHRLGTEGVEGEIREEMAGIVKKLRLFRSAHRTRARFYLTVPAPERLPMTAGKSLLKADIDGSMAFLDSFMLGRLQQTV